MNMSRTERALIHLGYTLRVISDNGDVQEKIYEKDKQKMYFMYRGNRILYRIFDGCNW